MRKPVWHTLLLAAMLVGASPGHTQETTEAQAARRGVQSAHKGPHKVRKTLCCSSDRGANEHQLASHNDLQVACQAARPCPLSLPRLSSKLPHGIETAHSMFNFLRNCVDCSRLRSLLSQALADLFGASH